MPVLLPLRNFGYPEFCKMMEDDSTIYIRRQIEDFIQSFSKACSDETMLRQSSGMFPAVVNGVDAGTVAELDEAQNIETLVERQRRRGKEYLKIMESFAMVILKDPFWTLLDNDGKTELDHDSDEMALYFELVFSFLEIYIVPQIHRYLFVPDKKSDWEISVKCLEYEWIRPIHLDIHFVPEDLSLLIDKANNIFTEMAFEPIPSLKAGHLGMVWKLIEVFVMASRDSLPSPTASLSPSHNQNLLSMDDIFPILVYILIKTHPPQLSSDLEYLGVTCREMATFGSFTSFYVANTQAALEFVKNLSQEKLSSETGKTLLPSIHSSRLRESLTQAVPANFGAPVVTPSSPTHIAENAAKSTSLSRLIHVKDRLSKTVEKVADHVSGTVSLVSSFSPINAVASVVRSTPPKLLPSSEPLAASNQTITLSNPIDTSTQSIMTSWIDTGPESTPNEPKIEDSYRFYQADPSQLSLEDITLLLNEYKNLAEFHFKNSSSKNTHER